jgi:hypothetical protein
MVFLSQIGQVVFSVAHSMWSKTKIPQGNYSGVLAAHICAIPRRLPVVPKKHLGQVGESRRCIINPWRVRLRQLVDSEKLWRTV